MAEEGALVFEYVPLPMSPMTLASLILLGITTFLLGPFLLPPDLWPIGGLCFLPLAAVVAWALLQSPSPIRIRTTGIEMSLPLWRRIARRPAFVPWLHVRNVYPATYEIAGAAMSPFASSAGTLVHTGLGLELRDGRRVTLKFTPGAIQAFRGESPGFTYAMEAVRKVFADLGRPLVTDVRAYSDEEVRSMHEEARQPLLGLATIVFAFFLPPTIVAGALVLFDALDIALDVLAVGAVFALAAIPPVASMAYTLKRSRRRNQLLSELAKFEEHARV